jgi:hypothetical protein
MARSCMRESRHLWPQESSLQVRGEDISKLLLIPTAGCHPRSAGHGTLAQIVCSLGTLMTA